MIARLLLTLWMVSSAVSAADLATEKKKFAAADAALNKQYQVLKKSLSKWDFGIVQKDQRDWIGYRDSLSERAGLDGGKQDNPKLSEDYWAMAASLTETRTAILLGYQSMNKPAKWVGVYRDSYGGLMTIKMKGGKLHFSLSVVRGPTHHVGEIEGVATTNKDAARFTDNGADHKEDGETWLDFRRLDGARVEVRGINTHFYHGARAYFDGTYVRVK